MLSSKIKNTCRYQQSSFEVIRVKCLIKGGGTYLSNILKLIIALPKYSIVLKFMSTVFLSTIFLTFLNNCPFLFFYLNVLNSNKTGKNVKKFFS